MDSAKTKSNQGLVLFGLLLGSSLIICALIGAWTLTGIKQQGRTLSVTGAAYTPIRSNLAVWTAQISVSTTILADGYAQLDQGVARLKQFMSSKDFAPDSYELSVVNVRRNYNRDGVETGYQLSRKVHLESTEVDRITELAVEASDMIREGIMLESYPVKYLYTGLDSLKLEMIQAATENARERAERLVGTTGHGVGAPVGASVGVFQIRALRSQEVSSYGISDDSTIDKEIVSTVHIDFLID